MSDTTNLKTIRVTEKAYKYLEKMQWQFKVNTKGGKLSKCTAVDNLIDKAKWYDENVEI
jgi:ribosomal protein L23